VERTVVVQLRLQADPGVLRRPCQAHRLRWGGAPRLGRGPIAFITKVLVPAA